MKRISVFVCMLLMLSLLCLVGVASAETEEKCQHSAYCTAPTVCVDCGYEGEIEDIIHNTDTAELVITPTEHQYKCPKCGGIGLSTDHFTFCTSPNACTICGYEGEIEEIIHLSAVHDPETHMQTCADCGELFMDIKKSFTSEAHTLICNYCNESISGPHFAVCTAPNVCPICGYEGEIAKLVHENAAHDPDTHVQTCTECNTEFVDVEKILTPEKHGYICNYCEQSLIEPHVAFCTTPTDCISCDYEGEIEQIIHLLPMHDPETHVQTCLLCDAEFTQFTTKSVVEATCTTDGEQIDVCDYCGEEICFYTPALEHNDIDFVITPETHQARCNLCGELGTAYAHFIFCDAPGVCYACGYEGEIEDIVHTHIVHDPDTHVQTCTTCGEIFTDFDMSFTPEEHTLSCASCDAFISGPHFSGCTNPNVCVVCGYEGEIANMSHEDREHDAKTHEQSCNACGATFTDFSDPFVVEATCTADGLKTVTCNYCGEKIETILPALGHDWKLTDRIAPTCTTEGYNKYTCRRCNWWTRGEVQPALGTAPCTMLRAEVGDVACSVCPVCASTALTPETKAAVALVENAAAEGTDAQVIVREAVPNAKLSVKRIFCVRLVKDSADVQPGGAIRLRIPCAEAQGLTLLHLSESGELTEIAYELTDGILAFETDKVGVFLLAEAK